MNKKFGLPAHAAALCSLALISACGGGGSGGSSPPPSPPPSNTAPTFNTQSLATDEEVAATQQLTATDAQNHTLTFAIATQPQHGTASVTSAGLLSYSPAADYFGSDSLTVTVTDSQGAATTGTVNITVNNVNDAPVVQDDVLRVTVNAGQPIVVPALDNDHDADGDTAIPTIVAQPPHGGTITVDATTGTMTFEPANGYVGPISFTYRLNDGTVDSDVATVRAVIGEFESVAFLSDYTTPGVREVHLYDGIEIRRISDPLPDGATTITGFSLSEDMSTMAYVVNSPDVDGVFVKPLDGSAAAVPRYVTADKNGGAGAVTAALNADGKYMYVFDGVYAEANGFLKEWFVVDTTTGVARQIAGDMPGVIDVRIVQWHSAEPNLLMVQGQIGGDIADISTSAVTAFLGDASDVRTLEQIGADYTPGQHGSGEGFYWGADTRYIYHGEYKRTGFNATTNLLRWDREDQTETRVVRNAVDPDLGMKGVVWTSPDRSRMCFGFYEPTETDLIGESRFYALDPATPGSEIDVTGVLEDISTCQFASDNRTMIYRTWTAGHGTQEAFAIDSVTPGVVRPLLPAGEAGNEQRAWQAAPNAMRIAIAYGNPVGRYYTMPADGTGEAFLFSDTYEHSAILPLFTSNADGSFLVHTRNVGGVEKLELMSTHGLNLSIPLSAPHETLGARNIRWIRPTAGTN